MKEFELEKLQEFDGKEGKPAYVAYNGKVYDVSGSKRWKGGLHMNRHHAGNNLTSDIQAAPHEPSVLERYPQVGTLKKEKQTDRQLPPIVSRILEKAPFFRRHPHPMTIHFPIAFTFATLAFTLLYLITGLKNFDVTAFYCLGAAVFFTPVAIVTGFYTWWVNYGARAIRPVRIKQKLSFLLLSLEIGLFIWRWNNPMLLQSLGWQRLIYLLLVLSMFFVVTMIGWFGASLTFPIEKPENEKQ
ncbi:MAG: cytochrome b5 [Deltaproteobacteria bacterium]|nr:cytochrome b5 [Deltaproteobacteria bacterium]